MAAHEKNNQPSKNKGAFIMSEEKILNGKEMTEEELEQVAGGLSKEEYRPKFNAEIGNFAAGQTVNGTIYSIVPGYVVYVKISQNLIATDTTVGCERNIYGFNNFKVGDNVAVYIERIIPEKLKIIVRIV